MKGKVVRVVRRVRRGVIVLVVVFGDWWRVWVVRLAWEVDDCGVRTGRGGGGGLVMGVGAPQLDL